MQTKKSFVFDVKKSAEVIEREQNRIMNSFRSSNFISNSAINEIAQVYLLAQQKLKNESMAFECFLEIAKRLGFKNISDNDFIVLSDSYFYNSHFQDVLMLLKSIAENLQKLKCKQK